MNISEIARVCHEVNRAYCSALGDLSQLPWLDAPEWQRQSAIVGVQFILNNPDASPAASHESWLAEKQRGGWKYGPIKDQDKKEHPCFVPYNDLPTEQRAKDYIFGAIVRSCSPMNKGSALTEGEYRVGKAFNPSANPNVDAIKAKAADLIDMLAPIAADRDHPGARCASVAMTEIESAAMWAVKAVTKQAR